MKIKTCIILILATAFLSSCGDRHGKIGRTVIRGNLPDFKDERIALSEIELNKAVPIDTTKISGDGSFSFKFDRDSAGFYLLKVDNRNYITLALDREKSIRIKGNGKNLKVNYFVEGSEGSSLLQQFESVIEKNRTKVDSLTRVYQQNVSQPQFQAVRAGLEAEYEKIFQEQRAYVMKFLDEHCSSLASLMVINRRFGQRKVITEEVDSLDFFRLDSCLSRAYPGNRHVKAYHNKVEKIRERQALRTISDKAMAPGRPAPEMKLRDAGGKMVSLHDLKGKKVILYFWSTTCEACRAMNPRLLQFYHENRQKGIEVMAVSFDSYEDLWKDYIARDKLDWINVSDLMGENSPARTLFNVPEELPYLILIDRESIISYRGADVEALRKFAAAR